MIFHYSFPRKKYWSHVSTLRIRLRPVLSSSLFRGFLPPAFRIAYPHNTVFLLHRREPLKNTLKSLYETISKNKPSIAYSGGIPTYLHPNLRKSFPQNTPPPPKQNRPLPLKKKEAAGKKASWKMQFRALSRWAYKCIPTSRGDSLFPLAEATWHRTAVALRDASRPAAATHPPTRLRLARAIDVAKSCCSRGVAVATRGRPLQHQSIYIYIRQRLVSTLKLPFPGWSPQEQCV